MAGTVRTGPYLDPVGDWRTVNPQDFDRAFPDVPQNYSNWNEYIKAVLTANESGSPGPRPYGLYGDQIGNPDVQPMEWLQNSLGYARLAPYLDQSDPQIQQMLDNMYYAGTSHDEFNFLGDQFFPAVALLGGAVGGASLYGAGLLPEVIPGAAGVAGAAPSAGGVTGATGLSLVPELEGGTFGALGASSYTTPGLVGAAGGAASGLGGLMGTYGWLGPAISAGGGLLQGLLQSNAARNAADTQAQSARDANLLLAGMYEQGRQDLAPYRAAGVQALGGLQTLAAQPLSYGTYTPTPTLDPTQYVFTPPTLSDDPGYQFRLQQGQKALDASAAARGGALSGLAAQRAIQYGQELGSQEYQNTYNRALGRNQQDYARAYQQNADLANRTLQGYGTNLNALLGQRQQQWNELASLANTGQISTSAGLNLGANLGAQQAGNITSAGAANAAGQVGSAQGWANAIGGIGNAANQYYNQQLLASLLQRR